MMMIVICTYRFFHVSTLTSRLLLFTHFRELACSCIVITHCVYHPYLEYARQFVRALRNPRKSDNSVKALFGEHIIKLHRGCKQIKLKFVKLANKTGKLGRLSIGKS